MVSARKASSQQRGAGGSCQPDQEASSNAGADSERRRLSSIFQRPSSGYGRRAARAATNIQGSNCQSPRTQRCWRASSTS